MQLNFNAKLWLLEELAEEAFLAAKGRGMHPHLGLNDISWLPEVLSQLEPLSFLPQCFKLVCYGQTTCKLVASTVFFKYNLAFFIPWRFQA